MTTYLFYDIETTGLNKAFDQVLQFAAIRTDLDLNELARHELKIKLNPDVIPSPHALLTHQMRIQDSLQRAMSEYDAIQQIHSWMNTPATISLGFNSLNFDDEFLRFSFYRNLLPPYTHQYANQCSRMDLYPIAIMYFLYKNHVLAWPQKNNKLSLKLEDLNQANDLAKGLAHDAMVDVEATVSLARKLLQEKEMWQYLQTNFDKRAEEARIARLSPLALMIDASFGSNQFYQCPVYFLGNHRHYKNQTVWLSLDSMTLSHATPNDFLTHVRCKNKKMGEPGFIVPYRDQYLQHLTPERANRVEENLRWVKEHANTVNKIKEHFCQTVYPVIPETDVDASLYLNGFWTREEELFCRQFHAATPPEKSTLIDKVENETLKQLATRLLGRHFPQVLSTPQQHYFNTYLKSLNPSDEMNSLIDYKGERRLTPAGVRKMIHELLGQNPSDVQIQLLKELDEWLGNAIDRSSRSANEVSVNKS